MGIGFKKGGMVRYFSVSVSAATGGTASGNGRFAKGKNVTVVAAPSSSYVFDGWYEGNTKVSSSASYTFTITSNRMLQARFIAQYTVSVNAGTGGTASGGKTANVGSSVTVTASPNTYYTFDGWYEGNTKVSSSASYTFTLTKNVTLQARFKMIQYTVTVNAATGGTASGGKTANVNSSVTVTASPNTYYAFDGWYEGNTKVSSSASYTFTLTKNVTLQARFKMIQYTVTVSAATGGTASGGKTANAGSSVTVTASASYSHNFAGWYEGDTKVSSSASYTFTLTSNRKLQARFTIKTYTISTKGTLGTASGGGTVNHGGSVTLTSAPTGSNVWVGWYEGSTLVSTNRTLTLTNITANRTLEARFREPVVGEPGTAGSAVSIVGHNEGKGSATWNFTHGKPAYIEITRLYQYIDELNSSAACYEVSANSKANLTYGTTKLTVNCHKRYPYGSTASSDLNVTFNFIWSETSVKFTGVRASNQYDTRELTFIPHY